MILPQTDLEGARNLAEQIRQTVAGNRIRSKVNGLDLGRIAMSTGCAQCVPGEPLTILIQRANEALYRAKRAARNRVLVAPGALGKARPAAWARPEVAVPSLSGAG